jgi:hypothetical protein
MALQKRLVMGPANEKEFVIALQGHFAGGPGKTNIVIALQRWLAVGLKMMSLQRWLGIGAPHGLHPHGDALGGQLHILRRDCGRNGAALLDGRHIGQQRSHLRKAIPGSRIRRIGRVFTS